MDKSAGGSPPEEALQHASDRARRRPKWPKNLFLVRHGLTVRNVARAKAKTHPGPVDYSDGVRDQDTPLTDIGRRQANEVGTWFRNNQQAIDAMVISPYLRVRQTTELFLKGLQQVPAPAIIPEERIRELDFGIIDGLNRAGIHARYPDELIRRDRLGKYWYRPPGGESRPDVALRVHSFLNTLVREYAGLNVVVICHSVVILTFRRLLERWGEEEYLHVEREDELRNCSITHYAWDPDVGSKGKLMLRSFNQVVYSDHTSQPAATSKPDR